MVMRGTAKGTFAIKRAGAQEIESCTLFSLSIPFQLEMSIVKT